MSSGYTEEPSTGLEKNDYQEDHFVATEENIESAVNVKVDQFPGENASYLEGADELIGINKDKVFLNLDISPSVSFVRGGAQKIRVDKTIKPENIRQKVKIKVNVCL